jgi:predicted  nucleic acid-binding Zn-ribbon protein
MNPAHPRSSVLLNANDPVVMHLLAETALSDSMQMEVLSFEEAEDLKKELSLLTNRIEASKRKLALELKLQEAAISLSRLHDTGHRRSSSSGDFSSEGSPRSHRRHLSFLGRGSDSQQRSDSEVAISTRKCEELSQELWRLERRAGELRRRLLEHTAGVLQMTHKGLKKKSSPKSVDEVNGNYRRPDFDDFDDRSQYRSFDYLDDLGAAPLAGRGAPNAAERPSVDMGAIEATTAKLQSLNHRLQEMILQARPHDPPEPMPQPQPPTNGSPSTNSMGMVQAHLDYLERALESVAQHQTYTAQVSASKDSESEARLEEINRQFEDVLIHAGIRPKRSPHTSTVRRDLHDQLEALGVAIGEAHKRIEDLTDQKTILTTQIQQQRELNTKSDAERDSHIADLSTQVRTLQQELDKARQDAASTREELATVIDQLDSTRQHLMLQEQQRAEENATHVNRAELEKREKEMHRLEETIQQLRAENDQRLAEEKESFDKEISRLKSEYSDLESEMVRIQTELTLVKAELDGAYGSRAERAAEAAANPALQKEIEELSERNLALTEELATLKGQQTKGPDPEIQQRVQMLEQELRETIDDYEALTKSSIEFEKERDKLEAMVDKYRDRCEELETTLSDDKIQGLGSTGASGDTTSTTVLKNEFKKMMRDTRTEHMRMLKVCPQILSSTKWELNSY